MRNFARHDSLSLEALPPHNQQIVGDVLFNLTLNYKWRKILSEAIDQYLMNSAQDDITLDNQDLLDALYIDLYDFEGSSTLITHAQRVNVGSTKTATSAIKIILNDLTIPYTFTRNKARIRLINLTMACSIVSSTCEAEIRVNGLTGSANTKGVVHSWNNQQIEATAYYENLNDGSAKSLQMYWSCDNGQMALAYVTDPIWEIYEYDD